MKKLLFLQTLMWVYRVAPFLFLKALIKLIPVLFQNGFDPQEVVNRRLKVFSHANEVCKRPSLIKKRQRTTSRQGIKWGDPLKENY